MTALRHRLLEKMIRNRIWFEHSGIRDWESKLFYIELKIVNEQTALKVWQSSVFFFYFLKKRKSCSGVQVVRTLACHLGLFPDKKFCVGFKICISECCECVMVCLK